MSSASSERPSNTLTENDTSSSGYPPDPNGWTWTCDELGNITACSPEVKKILGIPPEDFIGKPLTDFALPPQSGLAIESSLNESSIPIELQIDYQHSNGTLVPVSIYIITTLSRNGELVGWHGFTQALLSTEEETVVVEDEPKQDFSKLASAIILDMLGDIRKNHPSIVEYPKSRLTVKEHKATPGSAGPRLITNQSALDIEHKLIWGNKLDLDYEEELFIRNNRFRPTGPRGFMQRMFSSGKIVKNDYKWFAVVVRMEADHSYIWFSYKRANVEKHKIDLLKFLHNPDTILREVSNAIKNPWEKNTILEAGKDYLRDPDS